MNVTPIGGQQSEAIELGCLARDVVTGFEGIVIAHTEFLDGNEFWALEPRSGKGPRQESSGFPAGRVERIGDGICHSIRALKLKRGK